MADQAMATEILKKPYARMIIPDSDGSFVAEIAEFPGCMAVGSNAIEALELLEEVAEDWIAAALAQGQEIPEPMETTDYSGKLVLRMPKSLHQRSTLFAERDGVSLNHFIVTCLAERVGERARHRPMVLKAQATQTFLIPAEWATGLLGYQPHVLSGRTASSEANLLVSTELSVKVPANARN